MILRARVVLPIVQPPISDGAVVLRRGRIEAVGRWRALSKNSSARKLDLGEVVLLPGLINAHCHLDYTHMAGQFPSPRTFTDWLKLITTTKAQWSPQEYVASWLAGAQMLVRNGTTTVADIEAVPSLLPDAWNATPLRVISFLEMIGITKRRLPEVVLGETLNTLRKLRHHRCVAGLSPHAPYSTVPSLMRQSAEAARRNRWLLCTHVAESKLEFQMFSEAKGNMFDWLEKSGREMSDCGEGSPIQHLERCGMLHSNLLATHANYLARGDAPLLARRGVSVVHCPRSHAYFGHERFPLERLSRAGVNICLGTDSLATVIKPPRKQVELDLFAEMRALADRQPAVSALKVLKMATVNGARALGRSGAAGELSTGAAADMIALPYAARPGRAAEAILEHQGPVTASMIGGTWAVAPHE